MVDNERESSLLSPRGRRLVRSYGLLVLIAIGFLLMAMMVRETEQTVPVESLGSGAAIAEVSI